MFHKMRVRAAWRHGPLLAAAFAIFAAPASPPAHAAADAPVLRATVIDGSTVYSPAELYPTYRDGLGRPLTRENAQSIAGAISARYHDDGYARPEVRLDGALAASGVLRIRVAEPYIARVTIEGDAGGRRAEIDRVAAELQASRPLRRDAIARAMGELRRLPGLSVTPSTRREGGEPGAWELLLQVDYRPVSGSVTLNNRGTDAIGRHFALGQFAMNDLLGRGERLGILFSAALDTDEYASGGLFVDAPFGTAGGRWLAMVFRSDSAPNEAPVNLDDRYARERFTLRMTRPLGPGAGWSLAAALDAEDLTVDRAGVDVRRDRLRVVELGLRGGWRARAATQFAATLSLRQGLDALGAGLRADDLPADPRRSDFRVAQLQFTGFRRFGEAWSLRGDAFAQYSGHVLPDSERFKIGGERLGRGFEVAEIAGDRGLGAKLVLRRELTGDGAAAGRISAYALYDIGAAWKEDLPGRDSAATAGIGIASQGARWSGYLEVVRPLTHADVEGKRRTAVFAELGYRF